MFDNAFDLGLWRYASERTPTSNEPTCTGHVSRTYGGKSASGPISNFSTPFPSPCSNDFFELRDAAVKTRGSGH